MESRSTIGALAQELGLVGRLENLKILRRKIEEMEKGNKKLYGEMAVEMGFLTEDGLRQALNYQKQQALTLGRVILDNGLLERKKLIKAIKEYASLQ